MLHEYNIKVKTNREGEATAHCGEKPKCEGCKIRTGAVFSVTSSFAPRGEGESVHNFNKRSDSSAANLTFEIQLNDYGIKVGSHARTIAQEIASGTPMVLTCPTGDTVIVQGSTE